MSIDKNYDHQGNASHYNMERVGVMQIFERSFGTLAVMHFCELNALKYRLRMGKKENQSAAQELLKAKWYEKAANFYFERLGTPLEVPGLAGNKKHGNPWDAEDSLL